MKNSFLSDFSPQAAVFGIVALVVCSALAGWGGYILAQHRAIADGSGATTAQVRSMLVGERLAIKDVKAEQNAHLDALALKIAELQAHVMRLDAIGDRLVEVGKLDPEEFDFGSAPPVGGIDGGVQAASQSPSELTTDMDRVARLLADREDKLRVLEQMLLNREVMAEVVPSGKPVKKGWMSSGFGRRTDPINGKKSLHHGVDFAGKPGSDVIAVASGVVTRAEMVAGYGNIVELRHADGFSTRYAHNQENRVKVGDVVNKGDTVALLGSTGRSSGPHVHFEVRKDGKIVNPSRFLLSR